MTQPVPRAFSDLAAARVRVVTDHVEAENREDFDSALAGFEHPRYELVPLGEVYEGEAQIRAYYRDQRGAFPDQRIRLVAVHPADESVVAEFVIEGTHRGKLRHLPPPGLP
jgi:hypothetical protein